MSFTHPRRTTKTTLSVVTPTSSNASGRPTVNTNMNLRKSATFHSPTTPEHEETFKVPSLPRRSQTTLEDVVDAHKRRVALTLGDIDRGLAAVEERSPTSRQSFRDESDPVPQGFLNHTVDTPATASYGPIMDGVMIKRESSPSSPVSRRLRPRLNRLPSRYSDSGLGSSIRSSSGKKEAGTTPTSVTDERCSKTMVNASAITRSAAHSSTLPRLSNRASNRIHEHILKPLLAKKSLGDFHPIIKDCPRRIHGKEIVCLRDLEKTLIFMAPERTKSAALYLDFCLTSIRCIQATVEFLSEREQTRPSDRPYTNGYFVDLVDQIKQYAQQVQAAKEKEEKGETLDEMDPHPTDEVKLHGGLTKNGRPAELVRVKKNGKAISIATGQPVNLDEDCKDALQMKRSLSEEAEDDEAIMRSMARRKRSASAAELAPKRCREPGCDKYFKRPCDLTKHEKTHSRPWKCPDTSCKYHEYGWPTEKEMARHHNDKHESAPPLYKCYYTPCPYKSKRESNCKQHMEKAHGWEYVRSKNNGKNREGGSTTDHGLPTPQTTNMRSPSNDSNIMHTPENDDNDEDMYGAEPSMYGGNNLNFPAYSAMPDMTGLPAQQTLTLDYSPITESRSSGSEGQSPFDPTPMAGQDQFQDNPQFNNNMDWGLFDDGDLYNANVHHLPTPSHEVYRQILAPNQNQCFETSGIPFGADPIPHISPSGQGNTMLYSPTSLRDVDEGFEDFVPQHMQHRVSDGVDFPLFPISSSGTISSAPSQMFGEIRPNYPPGFPNVSAQQLLDFYNRSTTAALQAGAHNANANANMNVNAHHGSLDWSSEDQYSPNDQYSSRYTSEERYHDQFKEERYSPTYNNIPNRHM